MQDDTELRRTIEQLGNTSVVCIGDIMLDHFVYGRVDRISPEAPVPVLQIERETRVLGGAGNTLRNLAALGATITFVSAAGDDDAGRELNRLLQPFGRLESHLLVERGRRTTVKTRFVGGAHQMLRADHETITPLDPVTRADLLRLATGAIEAADVVVLSDYGKGVLTDGVAASVIAAGRGAGRPVIVDPKGTNYEIYHGATLVKPNRVELAAATRMPVATDAEVIGAALWLKRRYKFDAVLVSLGAEGMLLVGPDERPLRRPTQAREVFDVSGAGDTVVAVLAAGIAAGITLETAAEIANVAAGVVVGKVGTAAIHRDELLAALAARQGPGEEGKIVSLDSAVGIVEKWRARRLRIGFTSGRFDVLQPGDARLLRRARRSCDRLVVGLHDGSIAAGAKVQPQSDRAVVLASLEAVDLVIPLTAAASADILAQLQPEIVVSATDEEGAAATIDDFVRSYDGRRMSVSGHAAGALPGREN